MCKPASMVLTKHKVFWSKKTDSHESIIEEFKLAQDGVRGPNVIRVEICPTAGNINEPLENWVFHVDQDLLPGWFNAKECEARTRNALIEWTAAKIIRTGSRTVTEGRVWAYGDSTVKAYGKSYVEAYANSHVEAYANSHVEAYEKSYVEAYGKSYVEAYDNSTVKAYANSHVEAYENATIRPFWSIGNLKPKTERMQ